MDISHLRPTEILFLYKKKDLKPLLKVAFFTFIHENEMILKYLKVRNKTGEKAYFLFNNSKTIQTYHEKVIIDYVFNNKSIISLKEWIDNLSHFANPIFRKSKSELIIENHIKNDLTRKNIYYKKQGHILFIKIKKSILTQKGENYKEKLNNISWLNAEINYKWFTLFFQNIYKTLFKIDKKLYDELDSLYNDEFENSLNRKFMPFPNFCDFYPVPINEID